MQPNDLYEALNAVRIATLSDRDVVRLYHELMSFQYAHPLSDWPEWRRDEIINSCSIKPKIRALFVHHLMLPWEWPRMPPEIDPLFSRKTSQRPIKLSPFLKHITLRNNLTKIGYADAPERFLVWLSLSGRRLSYRLSHELLQQRAYETLALLIRAGKASEDLICDLAKFICYHHILQPSDSITILTSIKDTHPDFFATFSDERGNGLLWYTLYREAWQANIGLEKKEFCESIPLQEYLLFAGAAPEKKNSVGLSWRDVMDARELIKKYPASAVD